MTTRPSTDPAHGPQNTAGQPGPLRVTAGPPVESWLIGARPGQGKHRPRMVVADEAQALFLADPKALPAPIAAELARLARLGRAATQTDEGAR